ncbi:MAG: caspase family protein [Desulfobacterales bacterium]|nr:MAG: caspase family protein [Desulfobacterales bacterium]
MAKKALCIGINDYPGTQSDLTGCVNDAHDWAGILEARQFEVHKLLDAQATKAEMERAIGGLIAGAKPGDTLVITYSGHGTWVPDTSGDEADGRDEGLCPHDIRTSGALLDDEIHALFSQRRERVRILLLSDSCHSGSVIRGDESDLDEGGPRARFLPLEAWMPADQLPRGILRPGALFGGLARVGGELLLAGCMDTEYSWDTQFHGRPNGAFTYYAIKTLKNLPSDATYEQWYRKIRDYLPSTRLPQNPQIMGSAQARRFRIFQ